MGMHKFSGIMALLWEGDQFCLLLTWKEKIGAT